MLTLLLACAPRVPPETAAASAPPPLTRVVIDDEGTEHAVWKLQADTTLANDLLGPDAVAACVARLDQGYEVCALQDDCITVVVTRADGELSTVVALDARECSLNGAFLAVDTDRELPPSAIE